MTFAIRSMMPLAALALTGALLVSGCSDKHKAPQDGASSGSSLGDQIAVDPDKTGHSAPEDTPQGEATLSPQDRSPQAIAAALAAARSAAGGTITSPPVPEKASAAVLSQAAATAAQVTAASRQAHKDCTQSVGYDRSWVGRLPAELPVYPRGTVQDAAGVDGQGCALKVVSFITPVSVSNVIGFYYTKAGKAGYSSRYRLDEDSHVLGGSKQGRAYVVYASRQDNGLTSVDLVVSGS